MLRVTIDLIPFGREELKKELGVVEIINDGTGNAELGNYDVYVNQDKPIGGKFRIENFIRSFGFWELVTDVLNKKIDVEDDLSYQASIDRRPK